MTCIIGLIDGGKVYLGGDSCGSNGYTFENCNHSKVFKVDDFVIGATTSFRMLDLLEYSLKMPEGQPTTTVDMEKFMRTTFVKCVRETLKEGGFVKIDNGVEQGGTFLIGYKDKLWRMQDDFSVISRIDYDAVGCGTEAAIGSLFTTRNSIICAKDRINFAMQAAESLMVGVKGPFNIIST